MMNLVVNREGQAARSYEAPTLKVFGNVVALTAAGTGPTFENGQPGSCSQNKKEAPCRG